MQWPERKPVIFLKTVSNRQSSEISELSYYKSVCLRIYAMRFPYNYLLEFLVRLSPLLHQNAILVELIDQPLNNLVLKGQFLQK